MLKVTLNNIEHKESMLYIVVNKMNIFFIKFQSIQKTKQKTTVTKPTLSVCHGGCLQRYHHAISDKSFFNFHKLLVSGVTKWFLNWLVKFHQRLYVNIINWVY